VRSNFKSKQDELNGLKMNGDELNELKLLTAIIRDADYRHTAWVEAARSSSGINHQPLMISPPPRASKTISLSLYLWYM
jgi:hypothetical protein